MEILKRSGQTEQFQMDKIRSAIQKAFVSTKKTIDTQAEERLMNVVHEKIVSLLEVDDKLTVERVQDMVEEALMAEGYFTVAKNYILYRDERRKLREHRLKLASFFPELEEFPTVLEKIENDFDHDIYGLDVLGRKFESLYKENRDLQERTQILVKAASELMDKDAIEWEYIAARIQNTYLLHELRIREKEMGMETFYDKLQVLTNAGLYAKEVLAGYTKEEIEAAEKLMVPERDEIVTISGLEMLVGRYMIKSHQHELLESMQEMFLGVALFLALKEKQEVRLQWVARFYYMLSTLKVTMATPTLANARKPFHQLSSCFIDTVPDDLTGIYRSISNFAEVSKFGGGMGLYFGKVRANGSDIRGFEGAAGGVIRWIRLANDTAVAVDQLGVRQGAVAVYLDAWHRDLPEFLALRTNNGDDRMKAHDVFPAVCYPNYFWEQVRDNIEGDWYLMCPHQIRKAKGYNLEDSFGDEWTERYLECVADRRIQKRVLKIKDIIRLIVKSAVETGTPFAFNRDIVNAANPNSHKGIIYCSNLCTEIAQNMSAVETVSQTIETKEGDTVVVNVTKPGDYVVCNLASLNLGKLNVRDQEELHEITSSAVRALDNVIDLNFFPVPYAEINNHHYRPIGLGVSGYHHMLATNGISWETEKHLQFVDEVFEDINYYAVQASMEYAREKEYYEYFPGSEWETGEYFEKRDYNSDRWLQLKADVKEHGLRNGYLLAIAPTASTSIIAATTPGIDPIQNRFYYDEKKKGLVPRVAPELNEKNYWLYKGAHELDQTYSVRANGIRQRHIDQAQSMNFYITNDYTFRQILDLYINSWENGVKTIYYIRSKALEVEECESCSI